MGWEALVDIQAPKDRAWARDKDALDLLTKFLEASILFTILHALLCALAHLQLCV